MMAASNGVRDERHLGGGTMSESGPALAVRGVRKTFEAEKRAGPGAARGRT